MRVKYHSKTLKAAIQTLHHEFGVVTKCSNFPFIYGLFSFHCTICFLSFLSCSVTFHYILLRSVTFLLCIASILRYSSHVAQPLGRLVYCGEAPGCEYTMTGAKAQWSETSPNDKVFSIQYKTEELCYSPSPNDKEVKMGN